MVEPSCLVSGGLGAILRVNKWLCIAPLRFDKGKRGLTVCLSPPTYYVGNVVVTIFSGVQIWKMVTMLSLLGNSVDILAWCFEVMTVLVPTALAVYSARVHMRCLIRTLNKVEQINSDLNVTHWPKQLSTKLYIFLISWMALSMLLIILHILLVTPGAEMDDIKPESPWSNIVYYLYYFDNWVNLMSVLQFMLLALHVRSALTFVNRNLNTLLTEDSGKWNSPQEAASVRRICSAYARACDAVRGVDSSHGVWLMVILSFYAMLLVLSPYCFVNLFLEGYNGHQPLKLLEVSIEVHWWFATTIKLMLLVEPCHATHVEMESTRELVGQLMRRTPASCRVGDELSFFYKQLMLNDDVAYQPMQVTTIRRRLVLTIIGSITTYLVIMLNNF